jgi:hypothetical protein
MTLLLTLGQQLGTMVVELEFAGHGQNSAPEADNARIVSRSFTITGG